MMRKVFWENPYQRMLRTKVTSVVGSRVLLQSTIGFSFSGGQESDKTTINGIDVLDSKMEGNLIYYTLPENHGLTAGDDVTMEINWERRYRLMRLHFTAELILEIVTQNYHLQKVGAHIAEGKSRIDFKYNANISTLFDVILEAYNAIIKSDQPIQLGFSDIEKQRRYWKIDGFAKVPCGGTHVRSTGEVGYVTLKRERAGKDKEDKTPIERIYITLKDNSVPEFKDFMDKSFFAPKKMLPAIPEGLSFVAVQDSGHGFMAAAALHLNKDPSGLRLELADYVRNNLEKFENFFLGDPREYLEKLEAGQAWADYEEMQVLTVALQRQLVVVSPGNVEFINAEKFPTNEPIFIHYNGRNHYDALVMKGDQPARAILATLQKPEVQEHKTARIS